MFTLEMEAELISVCRLTILISTPKSSYNYYTVLIEYDDLIGRLFSLTRKFYDKKAKSSKIIIIHVILINWIIY